MKKLKIYLDTSVISHLLALDTLEKMQDTQRLWDKIKQGKYEVFISDVVLDEIGKCPEPKKEFLTQKLLEIKYNIIYLTEEALVITEKMIDFGILKQKCYDDCRHISAAIVSDCDVIVSWNFKHIVNHKTMLGVKSVTAFLGYDDVLIYSPTILIEGESDE